MEGMQNNGQQPCARKYGNAIAILPLYDINSEASTILSL